MYLEIMAQPECVDSLDLQDYPVALDYQEDLVLKEIAERAEMVSLVLKESKERKVSLV